MELLDHSKDLIRCKVSNQEYSFQTGLASHHVMGLLRRKMFMKTTICSTHEKDSYTCRDIFPSLFRILNRLTRRSLFGKGSVRSMDIFSRDLKFLYIGLAGFLGWLLVSIFPIVTFS